MFYFVFKKYFGDVVKSIAEVDNKRIASLPKVDNIVKKEYSYIEDGNELHKLNVYKYALDMRRIPLVFCIHGGGWCYGDKDLNENFLTNLVALGFDAVAISYRIAPENNVLDMLKDIFASFKYVKVHQDELDVDFSNILLTGDSAGGHLALLSYVAATSDLYKKLGLEEVEIDVNSLVLNHPVPYLSIAGNFNGHKLASMLVARKGMIRQILGKHYKKNPIYKYALDPTYYIDKDTKLPKVMIITSEGDRDFCYQSKMLSEFLSSLGHKNLLYVEGENSPHVFNILYPQKEDSLKCNRRIKEFYEEN